MILAGFVLALGVGCEAKIKTPTTPKEKAGGPSSDPVAPPEETPAKGDAAKPPG